MNVRLEDAIGRLPIPATRSDWARGRATAFEQVSTGQVVTPAQEALALIDPKWADKFNNVWRCALCEGTCELYVKGSETVFSLLQVNYHEDDDSWHSDGCEWVKAVNAVAALENGGAA